MAIDYDNIPSGSVVPPAGINPTNIRTAQHLSSTPKHLAWPLRLVDGPDGSRVFATVDQDTIEEVTQSVQMLLTTQIGERYRDAPDYGVDDMVAADPAVITAAASAVATFEPRARVKFTVAPVTGDGREYVRVDVSLVEGAADLAPELDRAT